MNRTQQSAPQAMNAPPSPPLNLVSTEQIQKYLDENKNLIMAILECQKMGKAAECAQYQAILQKNLMYLAAIADAQPPGSTTPSQQQIGASSQIQQSEVPTAQLSGPVAKLPFQMNAQFQQQQQQQHSLGANNMLMHLNMIGHHQPPALEPNAQGNSPFTREPRE